MIHRRLVFLFLLGIPLGLYSRQFPEDSLGRKRFLRKFNLYLNMTELGFTIPLHQKNLSSLENGLNRYYGQEKSSVRFALLGASVYYRNKIGIGVIYYRNEFRSATTHFLDYLQTKYPDYYIPDYPDDYAYKVEGIAFSLAYRQAFGAFTLEPKFRCSFNSVSPLNDFGFSALLKEKGSNQYVKIDLSEHQQGYKNSHHFILSGMYLIKSQNVFKWELGLQSELMVAPIHKTAVLLERSYGKEPVTTVQDFYRLNAALAFSAFVNWKFGK